MDELDLDPTTGFLTLGRHRATEADIETRFVTHQQFSGSATRSEAWDQYQLGRDLLRTKVRIHSVWLGGSFLTSKVDANDVDALFIVSGRDYRKLDTPGRQVVDSFRPQAGPLGLPVCGHGLTRLDSYILMWTPFSPVDLRGSPEHVNYAVLRGYWDDWWPRERFNKPDGVPAVWKDALPVRGYLEVEIDAFDR